MHDTLGRTGSIGMMTLQNVIFPEDGLCTERDMYVHVSGAAGYSALQQSLTLGPGVVACFDTYFNAFSLGKWHAHCALDGLLLGLLGSGLIELRVVHAMPEKSWEIIYNDLITLDPTQEMVLDLSHYRDEPVQGVIFFEIGAIGTQGPATLQGARFMTRTPQTALPKLAISITTFRREDAVQKTVARLRAFLGEFTYGDQIWVQVVDNGQSAQIPASPNVSYVANPNLGGSGGFARGLAEAETAGATHCLFMDDDAAFHVENIARTYAFLALAKAPKTALAGAMINNTHKWCMWENGAVFDRACQPQFLGADLRRTEEVLEIEFGSFNEDRPNFYGGWWYFAFPVAQITHRPFPFFVRGDDISFSMANDFRIVTLNGLVSFQDDFTEKESPQTLYLDLRSHLVHHLVFDAIERGPVGTAWVALRFILRNLVRFQYETAEALLLAWRDVMTGPEFFAENTDMAARRKSIGALVKNETWQPLDQCEMSQKRRFSQRGWLVTRLFVFTLNGHFLPFFGHWGDRVVLPMSKRGLLHPLWGAARITYLNASRDKGYTVQLSMLRFVSLLTRSMGMALRFIWQYKALRARYRTGYRQMTRQAFWHGITSLPAPLEMQPGPANAAPSPH